VGVDRDLPGWAPMVSLDEAKKLKKRIKKMREETKQLMQEVHQFKSKVTQMEAQKRAKAEEAQNVFVKATAALRGKAEDARKQLPERQAAMTAKGEELATLTQKYASLREQIRDRQQQRAVEEMSALA